MLLDANKICPIIMYKVIYFFYWLKTALGQLSSNRKICTNVTFLFPFSIVNSLIVPLIFKCCISLVYTFSFLVFITALLYSTSQILRCIFSHKLIINQISLQVKMEEQHVKRLLSGDLQNIPKLPSEVVRIFLSSTFGGKLLFFVSSILSQ